MIIVFWDARSKEFFDNIYEKSFKITIFQKSIHKITKILVAVSPHFTLPRREMNDTKRNWGIRHRNNNIIYLHTNNKIKG